MSRTERGLRAKSNLKFSDLCKWDDFQSKLDYQMLWKAKVLKTTPVKWRDAKDQTSWIFSVLTLTIIWSCKKESNCYKFLFIQKWIKSKTFVNLQSSILKKMKQATSKYNGIRKYSEESITFSIHYTFNRFQLDFLILLLYIIA